MELTVKERIRRVILSNTDTWLSNKDVAELGYGEAYIRDSANGLNAKIARNMHSAISTLLEEGVIVLSEFKAKPEKQYLKECKKAQNGAKSAEAKANAIERVSRFNSFVSYKIATEDIRDEKRIKEYLKKNELSVKSAISKRNLKTEKLSMKSLLPEEYQYRLGLEQKS